MRRLLACSLMLAAGCVSEGRSAPRAGGVDEPPEVDEPPPRREVGDAGSGLSCFPRDMLPADCRLGGQWRLLHDTPEGDCAFGASRHDIGLVEGDRLCLEPGEAFQDMQPAFAARTCAIALFGRHEVTAATAPYTETWTSQLTFTGDMGLGETVLVVSGGNSCARKFRTSIDRK